MQTQNRFMAVQYWTDKATGEIVTKFSKVTEAVSKVAVGVTKCQLEVTKPAKMPSSIFQEDYGNTGIEIGDIINFSVLNV